jgi:hypothetical protein
MGMRRLAIAVFAAAFLTAASSLGMPQATVRSTGDYDPNNCGFWGDSLTLTISDGDRVIITKRYCSAYGESHARIVSDARAHNYVLLTHSEGHGTNAKTDYLTVYRLTDKLIKRTRVRISEGVGPTARWFYDYTVQTLPQGGLKLVMTLRIEGTPDRGSIPPEPARVVIVDRHR